MSFLSGRSASAGPFSRKPAARKRISDRRTAASARRDLSSGAGLLSALYTGADHGNDLTGKTFSRIPVFVFLLGYRIGERAEYSEHPICPLQLGPGKSGG